MSKLQNNHLFTSESVSEGHPDKVCDQVSDAILDACLAGDSSDNHSENLSVHLKPSSALTAKRRTMQETPKLWTATYEAKTADELAKAYKNWAGDYDKDTLDTMGYVGPRVAATILDYHLDSTACRVLDAGCGTGLVGEYLNRMGYDSVDAMDFSKDMLNEAEKKGVYNKLFQEDMNDNLDIPDDTYDATICVGTFTYAHVGPHAFEELVRVTRPGGHICFTIRDGAYQEYGYRNKMIEMEACSKWELQELKEEDYLIKENVSAKFCTYKVLDN